MPCACSSSRSGEPNAAAGAASSTVGCQRSDGDSYTPGLKKSGAAGRFDFTLLSSTPAPPALNDNLFVVQVSDQAGNPVSGELSVALDMPEHGHPSPTQPDISFDPERKAFVLDPMQLFMVGLWRITFSFDGADGGTRISDSAVFEFCIE